MSKEFIPFLTHSEITNEIYIVYGKGKKVCVTDQVIKAMQRTGRMEEQTAEWKKLREGIKVTEYKCSACGRTVSDDTDYNVVIDYPYCHCGCRMKEVE